tara:strand:- start:9 stop:197 length:189 start_codon:yes stop_codon:yes gene_type:complete
MFSIGDWRFGTDDKGNLAFSHMNSNTSEYELVKIIKIPKSHKKKKTTLQRLKDFGKKLSKKN